MRAKFTLNYRNRSRTRWDPPLYPMKSPRIVRKVLTSSGIPFLSSAKR